MLHDAEDRESSVLPPDLLYRAPGTNKGVQVPQWAHYLATIGSLIGRLQPPDGRPLTLALALPCRPYAAPFTAVGVVVGRALDESHHASADAHFRSLSALPAGTPVVWQNKDRVLKGILRGPARHNSRDYMRVQVGSMDGGRETRLIRKDKVLSIRVGDHSGKLPKKQTGRRVKGVTPFLQAWLGEFAPLIVERDRCDCVIIGRQSTLKKELTHTLFLIEGARSRGQGNLNDVVRAKPLVTSTSNHRAEIRTHRQGLPAHISGPEPPVVLFDGALAFLKCRPPRSRHHSVVVLNRSEPRFEDAVDVLMGLFHERGTEDDLPSADLGRPLGLELLAFREN